MKFGAFDLSIVRECSFKLDGGAMFGVVPKPMWNKVSPADEQNRVGLVCNLLVIRTPNGNVLVETGMGSRWTDKEKSRYDVVSNVKPESMLSSVGLSNDQIDGVIISHLHFDHAGGATIERDGNLYPTFPKARYFVQHGEWDFAHNANARAKASYRSDDFDPLQRHNVLQLVDGDSEVFPGVWVRLTGGHTSHHQVVTFESNGEKGVYFADILPTKGHLSPPWVMGYDHYPLDSCDVKSKYLKQAADENWLVVFDHEPGVPWGRIKIAGDGKFEFVPLDSSTLEQTAPSKSNHAVTSK